MASYTCQHTGEAGIQRNRIEFSLGASAQTFHEWVGELWTAVLLI